MLSKLANKYNVNIAQGRYCLNDIAVNILEYDSPVSIINSCKHKTKMTDGKWYVGEIELNNLLIKGKNKKAKDALKLYNDCINEREKNNNVDIEEKKEKPIVEKKEKPIVEKKEKPIVTKKYKEGIDKEKLENAIAIEAMFKKLGIKMDFGYTIEEKDNDSNSDESFHFPIKTNEDWAREFEKMRMNPKTAYYIFIVKISSGSDEYEGVYEVGMAKDLTEFVNNGEYKQKREIVRMWDIMNSDLLTRLKYDFRHVVRQLNLEVKPEIKYNIGFKTTYESPIGRVISIFDDEIEQLRSRDQKTTDDIREKKHEILTKQIKNLKLQGELEKLGTFRDAFVHYMKEDNSKHSNVAEKVKEIRRKLLKFNIGMDSDDDSDSDVELPKNNEAYLNKFTALDKVAEKQSIETLETKVPTKKQN
jgi:hypothetical protein